MPPVDTVSSPFPGRWIKIFHPGDPIVIGLALKKTAMGVRGLDSDHQRGGEGGVVDLARGGWVNANDPVPPPVVFGHRPVQVRCR